MDKFIEFNEGVFNTRHLIAVTKCERTFAPFYGIAMYITHDVERQYFNKEDERDTVFNQILKELLNK